MTYLEFARYGSTERNVDVTEFVRQHLMSGHKLTVPANKRLSQLFCIPELADLTLYSRKLIIKLVGKDQLLECPEWFFWKDRKIDCLTGAFDYKIGNLKLDLNASTSIEFDSVDRTKPNYIYYHVAGIGNWSEIVTSTLKIIQASGLYDSISAIRIGFAGDSKALNKLNELIRDLTKISIVTTSSNLQIAERLTLLQLRQDCEKGEAFNVLYLHTKGVTKFNTPQYRNIAEWVDMMHFYLVEKYRLCLDLLNVHKVSTVGCLYRHIVGNLHSSTPIPYFSGNFWWSTSTHIQTLSPQITREYMAPELWILSNDCILADLAQVNAHYNLRCPRELYVNLPDSPKVVSLTSVF